MTAACMDFRTLLSPFLDGELPQDELQRVQAHLDGCPACTLELKRLRATAELLHSAGQLDVPVDLTRTITRVIAERKKRRIGSFTLPPVLTLRYVMPTMATILAMGIALYWNAYVRPHKGGTPSMETVGVHVVPAPETHGAAPAAPPRETEPTLGDEESGTGDYAAEMPSATRKESGLVRPSEPKPAIPASLPAGETGNGVNREVDPRDEVRSRPAPPPVAADDDSRGRRQDSGGANVGTEKQKSEDLRISEGPAAAAPAQPASARLTWRVALVLPEEPILTSRPAAKDRPRAEGDAAVGSAVAGTADKSAPARQPEASSVAPSVAAEVAEPAAPGEPKRDVQGTDLEFPRLLTSPERPSALGRVMVLVDGSGNVAAARNMDGKELVLADHPVFASMTFEPARRGGKPLPVWVLLDPVARFEN